MKKDGLLSDYELRVFKFLNELEPFKIYSVESLSKPETRQQFIETIKKYILQYPHMNVSFIRDDCNKFRKLEVFETEQT